MSIKTTHEIKRNLALEAINSKLQDCTNSELSDILETLVANDFYNFTIVEEFEEPYEYNGNLYYSSRIEYLSQLPDKYNQYN
jgi:hypothetical protein